MKIDDVRKAVKGALFQECDGTYSDDPNKWTLEVASYTAGERAMSEFIDRLALHIFNTLT